MPNNVTNYLTLDCPGGQSQVDKILEEIAYQKPIDWRYGDSQVNPRGGKHLSWGSGTFDFNSVILMPEDICRDCLLSGEKMKEMAGRDWYTWCCDNWGTKWNSYADYRVSSNKICFETAWSPVPKVIERLSQKYSDTLFTYEHYNEDIGSSIATSTWKNGCRLTYSGPLSHSKEAYELLFKIADRDAFCFGLRYDEIEQNYVWVDDDKTGDEEQEK